MEEILGIAQHYGIATASSTAVEKKYLSYFGVEKFVSNLYFVFEILSMSRGSSRIIPTSLFIRNVPDEARYISLFFYMRACLEQQYGGKGL